MWTTGSFPAPGNTRMNQEAYCFRPNLLISDPPLSVPKPRGTMGELCSPVSSFGQAPAGQHTPKLDAEATTKVKDDVWPETWGPRN